VKVSHEKSRVGSGNTATNKVLDIVRVEKVSIV